MSRWDLDKNKSTEGAQECSRNSPRDQCSLYPIPRFSFDNPCAMNDAPNIFQAINKLCTIPKPYFFSFQIFCHGKQSCSMERAYENTRYLTRVEVGRQRLPHQIRHGGRQKRGISGQLEDPDWRIRCLRNEISSYDTHQTSLGARFCRQMRHQTTFERRMCMLRWPEHLRRFKLGMIPLRLARD